MLSFLNAIDTALFRFLNITLANPLTDAVMPFVTNGEHWVLAVILAGVLLLYHERRRGVWIALATALVFALCDQTSAHLLKPFFERTRPCHVVEGVNLLAGCSGAYSFPSAHATNSFGCAVFLTYVFPRWRWIFFGLSVLLSLSRVFVGVHYPFDILGGWLLGALIGLAVIGFVEFARQRRKEALDED